MSSNRSIVEEIDKSIHSEDRPLGKRVPGAPFALVALSYVALLCGAALILGALVWWAS